MSIVFFEDEKKSIKHEQGNVIAKM